jgi:hypothetical protein
MRIVSAGGHLLRQLPFVSPVGGWIAVVAGLDIERWRAQQANRIVEVADA